MAISLEQVYSQVRRLSDETYELGKAKSELLQYQELLNNNWNSKEMLYVNTSIADIAHRIQAIHIELQELNTEIPMVAKEIYEEELRIEAELLSQATMAKEIKTT